MRAAFSWSCVQIPWAEWAREVGIARAGRKIDEGRVTSSAVCNATVCGLFVLYVWASVLCISLTVREFGELRLKFIVTPGTVIGLRDPIGEDQGLAVARHLHARSHSNPKCSTMGPRAPAPS